MPADDKHPTRATTDESLRAERHKTDVQLAGNLGAIKRDAEEVVADARELADEVLSDARELEDEKLAAGGLSKSAVAVAVEGLDEDRAREDATLSADRARADAEADTERARRKLALASLLAFERQDTDLRLSLERTHADTALTSREDVLAMVSHDLRSLLGGIALSADLLGRVARAEHPDGKILRYAESIQRFTASMNRLVGDLLDAASIDAGKLAIESTRRDAGHLIRDAREAFLPAAAARGVELVCELGEGPFTLAFDDERILQVLTNLVGNALKFTDQGGRIELRVERKPAVVQFAVVDNGRGIAAASLDRIFDRFFQTSLSDRRGLGLGLFISKSIIDAHGGRIWVESTPGTGSAFYFELPVDPPPA